MYCRLQLNCFSGEQSDPNYHERTALVFHRLRKMLDPLNQALVFTNCICEDENNLPNILDCFSNIKFDEDFSDLIDRRINWCKSSDGALLKLPKTRLFPYLDQNPTRRYGIPPTRKEFNLMNTFHDLAETFIAKKYGYTNLHKLFYPYSLIPIERDDKLIILDLECDFITMQKQSFSMPLFSSSPLLTVEKPLVSIHPLNWTTCFSHKNVYSDQWYFELLPSHNVQTIYLSQNDLKQLTNETLAGRAIMFCYGYTLGQTRKMYGDNINSKELPDPITIQCVYHNNSDFSFGFVCFQLNTTSFDSSLKNQVWLSGPFTDYKEILKNFIAFQLNGFIDISTQKLKNLEMKSN